MYSICKVFCNARLETGDCSSKNEALWRSLQPFGALWSFMKLYKRPKIGPREAQDGPKRTPGEAQDRPNRPKRGPREAQERPKMAPRGPQDGPKKAQERPKMVPREPKRAL